MNKEVRVASMDDLNCIVNALNKATLDLKSKGFNQWSYPWDSSEIKTDILKGNIYVLELNRSIVGTFTIKEVENSVNEWINRNSLYLYRIAITPEMQGKDLGRDVIEYCCSYADKQAKSLYLDCWSGNKKLREFYSKTQLQYLGDFSEKDYYISVFRYDSK
ncbi:GNAT family N-acetyltransferase [Alkaliphilus pronyensis]|uniref:GNAT family N-acetyltransferase n=1 Tax=Alkaliphilus pronyensis TaxID=1482732 RepID=A0A6I0EVR0_9FIRM|nr:GNAT family N-acetyltransferase [Alkaliphilus pronyensis]KAB3530301.1 GNAT family N-acetyltransferase [Alkaliphilus pronyensis]